MPDCPIAASEVPAPGPHASPLRPSVWVERWLSRVDRPGRLLDFACGAGRHARLAARLGFEVLAVDRDPAIHRNLDGTGIRVFQKDLEHGRWPFAAERFDVVVCTHYLFRPRLDLLCSLVAEGGLLLYETFAVGNARYGRPSNPDFLLRPGELAEVAGRCGLRVLAFEDGHAEAPRPARLQRVAAVRPPFDPARLPIG